MSDFGGTAPRVARKGFNSVIGGVLAAAIALGAAVPAQATAADGAEKLRRLDIMLMVTSLRCRTTADNFTAEYGSFTTNHLSELNQASDQMRADLSQQYGQFGSARALDRISTVMANTYGQGHPWLSCRDLKLVTGDLAAMQGRDVLVEAADQLLGERAGPELAYARR
jgi:hypothetical protein